MASPTKGLKKPIAEAGNHSVGQLAQEENEALLLGVIRLRARQGKALLSATHA